MIKTNDIVQLFQLAWELLRLHFLKRRDKLSDTNLLFNLLIFFRFQAESCWKAPAARFQMLFRFLSHSKLKLINFLSFFASAREMTKRREVSHRFSPRINSFLPFTSFHFSPFAWLFDLLSLAAWVKSPSLAVHLNLNNFRRPLCLLLVVPPSSIHPCLFLLPATPYKQMGSIIHSKNENELRWFLFVCHFSNQHPNNRTESRNQEQKKLSSCLYNHPEKYRRNIFVAFLAEGTHEEDDSVQDRLSFSGV